MTKFYQTNELKIAFDSSEGKGPTLVFIHGFCEDRSVWDGIVPHLSDYPVIRMDLPGFGESNVWEEISIAEMAGIVEDLLTDQGIGDCILFGHSMGGYICLAFAEEFGDRLKGFGLIHSHPYEDSPEKKEGRAKGMDFVRKNGPEPFVKQLIPILFAEKFRSDNRPVIDRLIAKAKKYPAKGIIAALEAMRERPGRADVLAKLACPALFIIGEEDEAIPAETSLEQTSLPAVADIHILPGVGHMAMFEKPEKTIEIIQSFIRFCRS